MVNFMYVLPQKIKKWSRVDEVRRKGGLTLCVCLGPPLLLILPLSTIPSVLPLSLHNTVIKELGMTPRVPAMW